MLRLLPALALLALLAVAAPADADPKLTVSKRTLDRAVKCDRAITKRTAAPLIFSTGTGTTSQEGLDLVDPALQRLKRPVCRVEYPAFTTADIQVSAQYLVHAIRTLHKRSGRKVAIYGISQGGLIPRWALTFWPGARRQVSDVVAVAATMHGTTVRRLGGVSCGGEYGGCPPAVWQQFHTSNLIRTLDARPDESPGPTHWTTVRTLTDETVQPQDGPRPASTLEGASNISIQDVCPGRIRGHLDSYADSVALAALRDAITHRGPARRSRLPKTVCSRQYGAPLQEATLRLVLELGPVLIISRAPLLPKLFGEPALRSYAR